jgi:hypothetical protein
MASRSRLTYQSIESKGGFFARKKGTVKRQVETRITAQDLWDTFETSKDPVGDIFDLVDRTYKVAFTKLEPESEDPRQGWPKVQKLLDFAWVRIPSAIQDLRNNLEPTLNEYMRGDVRSVTDAQLREINEEIRAAKAVLVYLVRAMKELNEGVEEFLQKDTITTKEYHNLTRDISATLRNAKAGIRKEFGGVYSLPQPLKPLSESQIPGYRSRGSKNSKNSRSRSRSSDRGSLSRKSASIQSIARSASKRSASVRGWKKLFYRKK